MKYITLTTIGICSVFSHYNVNSQKLNKTQKAIIGEVENLESQIDAIAIKLWEFSEIALEEDKSSAYLINILEKEGFAIEKNIAGMPTAFIASFGSGKPIIGILAEYDALPGIGNKIIPRKEPREDGITHGHGCGHNLFGSGSVNGTIALKKIMEKNSIKGTIRLYGTPAEETVVGKVYMAKAGVFNDLDAAIDWHPATITEVNKTSSLAMNNFTVEFFGQSAHGAADPWNGRSALDAVEMMNFGVNLMREHIKPTTRIHYVITSGGKAPNVVPDYAKVWYYVRGVNRENVEGYYNRILKIAEAAAMATQTTHKIYLNTGVHRTLLNQPLMEAIQKNLELIGPVIYTQEEQNWGKELQRSAGKEEKGFDGKIVTLSEDAPSMGTGSTDVAEVSHIIPEAGFSVTTAPFGVPWHSWATAASHGTKTAIKGAMLASKVIALTGYDLLTDSKLLLEAKEYFKKQTNGKAYISPLPENQNSPIIEK